MKKVCLVLGAGRGIGATVAEKFALEGLHSHLCRRSNGDALQESLDQIQSKGGEASGELINAIDDGVIEKTIESVERDIGPIEVLIYNLGAQSGMKLLDETSYKEFEWGWRMASFGLFRAAKTLCPLMSERGSGTIIVTSATALAKPSINRRIMKAILNTCMLMLHIVFVQAHVHARVHAFTPRSSC